MWIWIISLCLSLHTYLFTEALFIQGSNFQALAQHRYDECIKLSDGRQVDYADFIFVKTDYLEEFIRIVHPTIVQPYILITHNSDGSAPGEHADLLDDPMILHWYGQNPDQIHPKFTGIPIGIANAYDSWGRELKHGNTRHMQLIHDKCNEGLERKKLLYFYFDITTNSETRLPIKEYFQKQPFCSWAKRRPYLAYLSYMADHKFAISPPGNGIDCHRTWECLYLGVIPIVQHSTLDPVLYELPVLFIEEWTEITEAFLQEKYAAMAHTVYAREKMYWPYWKQRLLTKQRGYRER